MQCWNRCRLKYHLFMNICIQHIFQLPQYVTISKRNLKKYSYSKSAVHQGSIEIKPDFPRESRRSEQRMPMIPKGLWATFLGFFSVSRVNHLKNQPLTQRKTRGSLQNWLASFGWPNTWKSIQMASACRGQVSMSSNACFVPRRPPSPGWHFDGFNGWSEPTKTLYILFDCLIPSWSMGRTHLKKSWNWNRSILPFIYYHLRRWEFTLNHPQVIIRCFPQNFHRQAAKAPRKSTRFIEISRLCNDTPCTFGFSQPGEAAKLKIQRDSTKGILEKTTGTKMLELDSETGCKGFHWKVI